MKRKSQPNRFSTEPSVDKFLQKSIKAQGIIYIESPSSANKKSATLQLKPQNKIFYHCYKRFKTFSYAFDHIHEQNGSSEFYSENFNQFNAIQAIQSGLNYMMFCSGTSTRSRNQIFTTQVLFYEQFSSIYQRLIKEKAFIWKLSFLAITESYVYDLLGQKKLSQIREITNVQTPQISDVIITNCNQESPQTNYQILSFLRQCQAKKANLTQNSYFAIFGQINSVDNSNKTLLLLVDSTKGKDIEDKNWDNSTCLVLNKCILGLQNKMQKTGKQIYSPFRDSKITRIMKPFLTFDSRIDAIGLISYDDQQILLSTLSLIKNLSRLRIPILKSKFNFLELEKQTPNNRYKIMQMNPQLTPSKNKTIDISQDGFRKTVRQLQQKSLKKQKTNESEDLIDKMKDNIKSEQQCLRNINNIRTKLKLMKKKKQLELFDVNLSIKNKISQSAQLQQMQFLKSKEQQAQRYSQSLKMSRVLCVNKSISKVEKLKLLKQYYSISLANQKSQLEDFKKNQSILQNYYTQKLLQINQNLKKSPKQLLQQDQEIDKMVESSKHKSHQSGDIYKKSKLPLISIKQSKRAAYIKQKIKKGRVDYYQFLDKNVSQYKSYSLPIKEK